MIKNIAIGVGVVGAAIGAYRYRRSLGRILMARRSRGILGKGIALFGFR